jgi:hypothetical protein
MRMGAVSGCRRTLQDDCRHNALRIGRSGDERHDDDTAVSKPLHTPGTPVPRLIRPPSAAPPCARFVWRVIRQEDCNDGATSTRVSKRASMAMYGAKAAQKVKRALHERKRGQLKSGRSGKTVTSRKQAIAIGLSEARRAGGKVPRKPTGRSTNRRKHAASRGAS